MEKAFIEKIFSRHLSTKKIASNAEIGEWAMQLICLVFPEKSTCLKTKYADIEEGFAHLKLRLQAMVLDVVDNDEQSNHIAEAFFERLPQIYFALNTDVDCLLQGDPAARSRFEIVRCYPGFFAISYYRIAHELWLLQVPAIPRIISEYAHGATGIDIHPGAKIGEHFFIDHGTGIVIGETTIIGNHVKLYQGVTLGALSVDKTMENTKRHPTVEDCVIIYSGATILGGETVIGHHSVIGGNVWLTKSIVPHSTVYHRASIEFKETENNLA